MCVCVYNINYILCRKDNLQIFIIVHLQLKTHVHIYVHLRTNVDSVTLRVASNVEVAMLLHAIVCSFVTSKCDTAQ